MGSAEGDQFGIDPELAPLALNGGHTYTMAPTSRESPVINKGARNGTGTDQRGLTRPVPAGLYDVGAVEVQAPVAEEAPAIEATGEPIVGETVVCNQGKWNTDTITDPVFSRTWEIDGEEVGTGSELELTEADVGKQIECRVEVEDGATSTAAVSPPFVLQPAVAGLSTEELDLGKRRVGSGAGGERPLTIEDTGGADLEIDAVTSTDPTQFRVEAAACEAGPIAPGNPAK